MEITMDFWPKLNDDQTASLMVYTGTDEVVNVPHIVAGYVTTAVCRWAFAYNYCNPPVYRENMIREITLEEGYESLYHGAFYTCSKLEKLSLPSTLKTIYGDPFETCDSLKKIVFPNGNEYLAFDGEKLTSKDGKTVYFTVKR